MVSGWSEQCAAASPTGHHHGPGVSRRACLALRGSSGYRHLTPGKTEALKRSRASNPRLLQALSLTGCAASHESLPVSRPQSVSSQNHGTRGRGQGKERVPGGLPVEADLESYGATEREGQRLRDTRDGNRERWRQVERDRKKQTRAQREGRRTESSGGDRKGQRRGKLCRNCGPEGDRLDEATVAAGWAGEPALRTSGPKQLEGAGEPDSRTPGSGGGRIRSDSGLGRQGRRGRGCPGDGAEAGLRVQRLRRAPRIATWPGEPWCPGSPRLDMVSLLLNSSLLRCGTCSAQCRGPQTPSGARPQSSTFSGLLSQTTASTSPSLTRGPNGGTIMSHNPSLSMHSGPQARSHQHSGSLRSASPGQRELLLCPSAPLFPKPLAPLSSTASEMEDNEPRTRWFNHNICQRNKACLCDSIPRYGRR